MAEAIEYNVEMSAEDFGRYASGLEIYSRPTVTGIKVLSAVLVAGALMLWVFSGKYAADDVLATARWYGIGSLIAGGAIAFAAVFIVESKGFVLMDEALKMQGKVHTRIDEFGVVAKSTHADYVYRWGAIRDVTEVEGGLCINVFGFTLVPVPDEALPDGLTRSDALARIRSWRQA